MESRDDRSIRYSTDWLRADSGLASQHAAEKSRLAGGLVYGKSACTAARSPFFLAVLSAARNAIELDAAGISCRKL